MGEPSVEIGSGRITSDLLYWCCLVVLVFFSVAGLVLASGFLAPLSIAVLLFILLTAIIDAIGKINIGGHNVPGWLAHILGVSLILVGLLAIMVVLSNQGDDLSEALPRYQERLGNIASRIIVLIGDKNFAAAQEALSDLKLANFASGILSSAGTFLSGLFLVLLYITFMMVERTPMRAKLELASPDAKTHLEMRKLLESISIGVQHYIGIKTFVSVLIGLGSYAIFRPVGLDFAETWAVLAFALNFIPIIGSILAVALPALVALVQFDTFTPFLIVFAGSGALQFAIGNILEPSLTGRSLNQSPLVVIMALTFWTSVWGVSGALLSVPITVCALIIMSHFPGTRRLAILMSQNGELMQDIPKDTDNMPGKSQGNPGAAVAQKE